MAIRNRVFRDYLDLYEEAVGATQYKDLAELQPGPFATLNSGGAGTAYALWRLGKLPRARAWIAASLADRTKHAYSATTLPELRRTSTMFGTLGLRWVHALVKRDAVAAYARAIPRTSTIDEYASGAAGWLLGAMRVLDHRADPALAKVVTRLADGVLARLHTRQEAAWAPSDASGFAHGWPGICYAALAWGERQGAQPSWLIPAVVRLADLWSPPAIAPQFVASWCNGAAGSLLLWAKAFAISGEARFLAVARRAARTAIDAGGKAPSLCCGDIGVAFALLALDRVDHEGGWRAKAKEIAARTIAQPAFYYPSGLFQGHPALVCLAQDLLDEPRGFPAVDA